MTRSSFSLIQVLLSFCEGKMTYANLKEQQKVMAEARVRRVATQPMLNSEPSGLQTRVLSKKKNEVVNETQANTNARSDPLPYCVPSIAKKQKLI